ncbi:MAG: outer membrane beta-barrel protein [Steroidobacteraceae bacterium]
MPPPRAVVLAQRAELYRQRSGRSHRRTLVDTVATYDATAALSFVLNYDWGKQDASAVTAGSEWSGVAAYSIYRIDSRWRVSVRGEALDDRNGFITGTPQTLKEGTVTFGYQPARDFELRIEGRYDWSNRRSFTYTHTLASTGAAVTQYARHQTELALQGLYWF